MEQTITYILKAKTRSSVWVFKYRLNGILLEVKFLDMGLTQKQLDWLFKDGNFPFKEDMIKSWKIDTKLFEITKEMPDLSFDAFWPVYGLKVNKEKSQKAWEKLSDADRIKCWLALPLYEKHLQKTQQAKAHLVTWINQKRFNDEY